MKYSPMELFIKARKNTLPEQIWVCIAAALTSTFYFYEYQYERFAPIRAPFLLFMTVVIFAVWIICSFFSGRDGRFGFAVFTFLYWGIPFVYTLFYAGRDNLRGYNKWLSMLNKISNALLCNPFSEASGKLNTSPQVMAAALVLISLACYIAGLLLKRRYVMSMADKSAEGYDGEYIRDEEDDSTDVTADTAADPSDGGSELTFGGRNTATPDLKDILGIEAKPDGADETPGAEE